MVNIVGTSHGTGAATATSNQTRTAIGQAQGTGAANAIPPHIVTARAQADGAASTSFILGVTTAVRANADGLASALIYVPPTGNNRRSCLWSRYGPIYLNESTGYTSMLATLMTAETANALPVGGTGSVTCGPDVKNGIQPLLLPAGAAAAAVGA